MYKFLILEANMMDNNVQQTLANPRPDLTFVDKVDKHAGHNLISSPNRDLVFFQTRTYK